ncbi:MAG: DNA repair exonuclease, partial [Oscillospiraceae bacterium]|nr:DNA repair exonuclease [Oscillospiraceae bacterium]
GAIHPGEIAATGLDYLALGHIHQQSAVQKAGQTHWAYPGCPEGRGFDELGEKGVLAGEIGKGSAELRFMPLARRKYEILTVDVTDREAEEAVRQALPASAAMDIIRVRLVGETEEKGVDLYRLQERLGGLCYALELRDETTVRLDLAAAAGEESLRGLFLRRMREKIADAETDEEKRIAEDALRMGLAALSGREL